jgi:hypothetical protein
MAYSTTTDVQRFFRDFDFDGSSNPTATEVSSVYIAQADSIIDRTLDRDFTVPITNSTDLIIAKYISARLAAQEIFDIFFSEGVQSQSPADPASPSAGAWRNQAMMQLDGIADGTRTLDSGRATVMDSGVYAGGTDQTTNTPKARAKIETEW